MQFLLIKIRQHQLKRLWWVCQILNQLGEIKYHKTLIKERLETLKQYHVINSSIGKISSTLIYIDEKPKRLLTVGLGNLKILSYQRLLKVWGQLFQYLKDVHVRL